MTKDDMVLTVKETAGLLRISRGLAYEMVRQGWLPSIRLGRRILVPRAALQGMLAAAERRPAARKDSATESLATQWEDTARRGE